MGVKKTPVMKLVDIQFTAREHLRASRNMDLALSKPKMERMIKCSTEEEYEALEEIVETLDIEKLRRWEHNHSSRGLEDLTIAQLRDKARKLFIKNYTRLNAIELLEKVRDEILDRDSRRDEQNNTGDVAHPE